MATAAYGSPGIRLVIPRTYTTNEARQFRSRVEEVLAQGSRRLVVDGEAWNQLDVTMLSVLVRCASVCRAHGASFELTNVSSEMKEHVRALSLNERIGLHD